MTQTISADASPPDAGDGDATVRVIHSRFPCFDGLRAIAALAVVLYHTSANYNASTLDYGTPEWIHRLGNFGVSTFFLISGFLLYRPYVVAHFADSAPPALGPFWKRRFFRIMPAYWVALTAALVLGVGTLSGLGDTLTAAFLLQNYRWGYQLEPIGIEWTLVIEVSFYLALPALAWLLRRGTRGASLERKVRGQLIGLGVLYLVAMAGRIWSLWFLDAHNHFRGRWFSIEQWLGGWTSQGARAGASLIGYLDWFALGMLLAVGSAWVTSGRRLPWIARMLAAHPWASWLLAIETYWVALQLNLPQSVFDPVTRVQSFGIAFAYGIVAFLLILPAVFGDQDHGAIRRLLRSRVMFALGTVSYGVYLWHLIFVHYVREWSVDGHVAENLLVWLGIVLPLTLLVATASYFVIEKPLIKLSHRRRPQA